MPPPAPDGRFTLKLVIMQGRNLLSADRNGLSDPYCKVYLGGKMVLKTDKIRKTLNPEWNKGFYLHPAGEHDVLLIEVWDWDRFTPDTLLGHCTIRFDEVIRGVTFDAWYHLEDVEKGEIKLELTPEDFGAIQGTLIAPGTDPASQEIFGDVFTIKSTKYYHVAPGRDDIDLARYAGKFVRLRGRTLRTKEHIGGRTVYMDKLAVGHIELLE